MIKRWKRSLATGRPMGWIAAGLVLIAVAAVGVNWGLEATVSDPFCLSCHEMSENIAGEHASTLYLEDSNDLHAACSDCHVPKPFIARIRRKLRASTEVYHHFRGTLDTPEPIGSRRSRAAEPGSTTASSKRPMWRAPTATRGSRTNSPRRVCAGSFTMTKIPV